MKLFVIQWYDEDDNLVSEKNHKCRSIDEAVDYASDMQDEYGADYFEIA